MNPERGQVSLAPDVLDRLMPMHLVVDADGTIISAGPTICKIAGPLTGSPVFDRFRVRRPAGLDDMAALSRHHGRRLQMSPADSPTTMLRGIALRRSDTDGFLINLSFGFGLIAAMRDHALTDTDFAPTDLAIELMYVTEAKSTITEELRNLNARLHAAKREAEERALTDTLTGLRNRRALDSALSEMLRMGLPFALMRIDLDFFKAVNDTLGHAAGDAVLVHVAEVLTAETRKSDTVARVGGDEFVVLFPEITDVALIEVIARRIIERLSRPIPVCRTSCTISASVGVALSAGYGPDMADQMLVDADRALYASKAAGRGRVTLST